MASLRPLEAAPRAMRRPTSQDNVAVEGTQHVAVVHLPGGFFEHSDTLIMLLAVTSCFLQSFARYLAWLLTIRRDPLGLRSIMKSFLTLRPRSATAGRVRPSTPEYVRVRPSTPEYARVHPSTPEYARVRPSTSEYARVRPSTPEYARVRPSTPECARVRPSTVFDVEIMALQNPFWCGPPLQGFAKPFPATLEAPDPK